MGEAVRWEWSAEMGLLAWIRNRSAGPQQSVASKSQEPRPENAKQMYAREAAPEKAKLTPINRMPPDQQAKVDKIKATLEKATRHIEGNVQSTPAAVPDVNGGREAVRQNMTAQDKVAPALSPTSAQHGKTAQEKPPIPSQEPPTKSPDNPRHGQPTLPRPRPSWER
jgi:hypothetical protein